MPRCKVLDREELRKMKRSQMHEALRRTLRENLSDDELAEIERQRKLRKQRRR